MTVVDLVGAIGGILTVIGFIVYVFVQALRGAPERRAEQEAREHFTRTGAWPDEPAP